MTSNIVQQTNIFSDDYFAADFRVAVPFKFSVKATRGQAAPSPVVVLDL